jgi:hypothetical protein
MELFLKGKFEDGAIVILNPDRIRSLLLQYEGDSCELTVRPYKKMISAKQMRWYRGVAINTIISELKRLSGEIWDHDDIHAYNISKIMKPKIRTKEVLGETIVETTQFSMKNMTKPQFEWFKNNLQRFWAEKQIDIPDPQEENFYNIDYEFTTGAGSLRGFNKIDP